MAQKTHRANQCVPGGQLHVRVRLRAVAVALVMRAAQVPAEERGARHRHQAVLVEGHVADAPLLPAVQLLRRARAPHAAHNHALPVCVPISMLLSRKSEHTFL